MRTLMFLFVGGVWIASVALPALAQTQTVTGQLVDLGCYARNSKNAGRDHDRGRECAWACVKWEGHPVGLVAKDGRVYQLAGGVVANNNEKTALHLTHTVTIAGRVSERDGMAILTADDLRMVEP